MDSLSVGQLMNAAAWGLGIGTAFFSLFGIRADKDVFLMMGLVACTLGNAAFVMFLLDQEGASNDTFVAVYACLALLSVYALYCQWDKYRREGCGGDEEEGEGGEAGGSEDEANSAGAGGQQRRRQQQEGMPQGLPPSSTSAAHTAAPPLPPAATAVCGAARSDSGAGASPTSASSSKRRRRPP